MGVIRRKIIQYMLKDFYALKDLEHPAFEEALTKLKKKYKVTSAPTARVRRHMETQNCEIDGYQYYIARSKKNRSDKKLLYIHGGGFCWEAFSVQWDFCMRLADKTGCEIIFPAYPVVPEGNAQEAHKMLIALYRKVLENADPGNLILAGDSAGGALCLSLSMLARDEGLPMAKELVLISPGLGTADMTDEEKARFQEIQKHDFIIGQFPILKISKLWKGQLEPDDYRVYVPGGSLEGLPKITVFSGTYDIMNIAARRLANRLKSEGHPYEYMEKEGGYHVYVLNKKSKEEFRIIADKILK